MQKRLVIVQDYIKHEGHLENPDGMGDGQLMTTLLDTLMNVASQVAKQHICDDPKCYAQALGYRIVSVLGDNFKDYRQNPDEKLDINKK